MKYWFILSLVIGCTSATAQLQFSSFQEVLSYADAKAISIQSSLIGEQISLAGKKEARADLLPTLNASLGYNDNINLQPTLVPAQLFNPDAPADSFEELTFGTRYTYSGGLQAQWDILNFQKIFGLQVADLHVEEGQMNTQLSRYNTYHQLASTYYSILLTQESIQIYEENVQVADTILAHAHEKYHRGVISEAALNRAKINQLQSQSNLDQAQSNLDQYYLQLQSQLNTREEIVIRDQPGTFLGAETRIQTTHPEVAAQEIAVQKSESLFKQSKSLRYPTVSLVYQNNQNWATNSFMDFSTASELPQQFFGVKVNLLNILSPSTRQKIRQSELEWQRQQLHLDNTRLIKSQEDQTLQLQLEQSRVQLTYQEQVLSLQQANDVHAENKYESGITSLDERLDVHADLLATQDRYLQSLAAFTLAQYKLFIRQIDYQPN